MSNEAPQPGKNAAGAGCLLAGSIILCTGIGIALRQPSIGFLVGAGVGVLCAIGLWLRDKGR